MPMCACVRGSASRLGKPPGAYRSVATMMPLDRDPDPDSGRVRAQACQSSCLDSTSSDDEWLGVLADASAVTMEDASAAGTGGGGGGDSSEQPPHHGRAGSTPIPPTTHPPLLGRKQSAVTHRIELSYRWLAALPRGSAMLSGVELRDTPDRGLGVFATGALPPGHLVVRLGRPLVVTQQRAISACQAFYGLGSLMEAVQCPATTSLALFLIAQRALHLLPAAPTPAAGSLGAWVATLPGYARLDAIPALEKGLLSGQEQQPQHHADEETLVASRHLRRQANAVRSWVDASIWQRASLAPYLPRQIFSAEAFDWAMGVIFSRGFQLRGAHFLLPMIDLLNHASAASGERNCEKEYDAEGAMVVRTTRAVQSGEELCHCYSKTDPPAVMFAKYGISAT
jgi:hypothetical protein